MCKVLQVSKSGYYHWLSRGVSRRAQLRTELLRQILIIYAKSRKRYGSPKITEELRELGYSVSRPRVARIMKAEGIRSITHRKFRIMTTDSSHKLPVAENLLNRDFTAAEPAKKWVSDITYIPTAQGWLFLTIIMDLYDRKVIGWSLSKTLSTFDTILPAWRMAIINRPIPKGQRLLFHSDRGVQYASRIFKDMIASYKVIQSMSRKGNCWDNAVAENFFRILKTEMVRHQSFKSQLEAKYAVFEFIEAWYNRKRKHAALGYLTPAEFGTRKYLKCA